MDVVRGDVIAYVYRKSGIKVRLYAGGIAAYEDCLAVLPDSMKAEFKKATDCKKLNGLTCTPTCPEDMETDTDKSSL